MFGPTPGALRLTAAVAVLLACAGCSGEDPEPAPSNKSMLAGAVGFGESRDTAYGSHKVNEIVDPVSDVDARAAGLRVKDKRVVAALVAECARKGETAVLSRSGWSALLTDGSRVTASVEPAPATEGAPTIDEARRVPEGECAYSRVMFVVPSATEVTGIHYAAKGARTATWRAPVGTSGRP